MQSKKEIKGLSKGAILVFFISAMLGLQFQAHAQLSGTYTIGGASPNYATFGAAVTALTSSGVSGPVVFNVRTNTYNENLTIGAISGTSATNTVTFQSETGVANNVTLWHATTTNYVVDLNGANYITFQNMTISYTGVNAYGAFRLRSKADNNTIKNCILNTGSSTSTGNALAHIYVSQTTLTTKIEYLTVEDNIFNGGGNGIYFASGTGTGISSGIVIRGNAFDGPFRRGLYGANLDNPIIENNTITNDANANSSYTAIDLTGITGGGSIKGNFIYTPRSKYGIALNSCNGTSGSPIIVANNMVAMGGSGTTFNQTQALRINGSSYIDVYFNSLHNYNTYNTTLTCALYIGGTITDNSINILDNIFSMEGTGNSQVSVYLNLATNKSDVASWDHNNYYHTGGARAGYFGTYLADLAAVRTNNGKDANSISIDPQFVSTTDLHTTETALKVGTPIAGFTTDIDGDIRQNPPYIGADEIPAPAVGDDAALTALVSPAIPPCPGSNAFEVEVTNYGTNTLTSVTVNWSINGVPQTPVNATGLSVPTNGSTTISLGSATLTSNTAYNFIFSTDAPNGNTDANQTNDSLINVGVFTSLGGTYTIGGASPDFANFTLAVAALNAWGVCGPVVFDVRQGTYTEQIQINGITNSSAINTVTFQADAANTLPAILQFNSQTSGDNYVLQFNGAGYLRFYNLTFNTTNTGTYARVIHFTNNNNDIRFEGNIIEAPTTTTNSTNRNLVYMDGNTGTFDNDIVFDGNQLLNGSNGFYLRGPGTSARESGNQIINNTITGFLSTGIEVWYQTGLVIEGNTITQGSTSASTPIGINTQGIDGDISIQGNDIVLAANTASRGIDLNTTVGTASSRVLIANNFITATGTGSVYGILFGSGSSYIDFVFNNLYINGNNATGTRGMYTNGANNVRLYNNNLQMDGSGYAIYTNTTSIVDADYNNYYYTASGNFAYRNANLANFGAWQSASGFEANSLTIDPEYASITTPFDLHISAAALGGAGMAFGGIAVDIDGDPRGTPPTIGADEITPPTGCNTPIAGNTVSGGGAFCANAPAGNLTGSTPTGGDGPYTYAWEVSTDGIAYTSAGTGQDQSYGSITTDTWYRRIVTAGLCADTSTAVTFTITPDIAGNTITGGGLYCDNIPAGTLSGSAPTGGTGTYAYQWQESTDGASFADVAADGDLQDYDHPALTAHTWYRRVVTSGQCTSNSNSEEFEIKTGYIWTGDVSSNWHVPANWDCGDVPDFTKDVLIPATAINQPEILTDSIGECRTIYLELGTELLINENAILNVLD